MICVFEASNSIEARMILDLLEHSGISGRIDGEYLTGGIGELQAMNLVRVMVQKTDYEAAKTVIREWEAKQPETEPVQKCPPKSTSTGFGFVLGLIAGIGAMYLVYNTPVVEDGIDFNQDGLLDETWTYKDNRIRTVTVDRNLDGKVDLIVNYSREGIADNAKSDENFDGTYETVTKYRRGQIYLVESDNDQDGRVDNRMYFKYGILDEVEILGNGYSSSRKKQKYFMGKLVSSEFDKDGDGVYESEDKYDFYEEKISKPISSDGMGTHKTQQ